MLCWLSSTHKRPGIFYSIEIGVKCGTLICSMGRSPAGAGLYGLLGRWRRWSRGGKQLVHSRRRGTFGGREAFSSGGVYRAREDRALRGWPITSAPSLRFSHSAMCHVDIPKLNSFYWVQFLASLTSENVTISFIFYRARSPRGPQIIGRRTV